MKLLLDTHTIIWIMADAPQLSRRARETFASRANLAFASPASVWEAATKFRLGKFADAALLVDDPAKIFELLEVDVLPISIEHARLAGSFANEHRDPFDRMLAAQSLLEGMALLSADRTLDDFAVQRIW